MDGATRPERCALRPLLARVRFDQRLATTIWSTGMLIEASTRAVATLDGEIVEVEVGMSLGLPAFSIARLVSSTEG